MNKKVHHHGYSEDDQADFRNKQNKIKRAKMHHKNAPDEIDFDLDEYSNNELIVQAYNLLK